MLDSINLADKTYDEILTEAIGKIPMYTDEWTNFNISDPGITVLQNLSMFTTLMREKINDIPEFVRLGLLSMLGFFPGEYGASEVFLNAGGFESQITLPPGEKLMAEDICFEADGEVTLNSWGVKGLYCESDGELRDITYLQSGASRSGIAVFGVPATVDGEFYVLLDDIPDDHDRLILLVRVMDEESRNPFGDSDLSLAEMKWQFYTKSGWVDVEAIDGTRGFLESGSIKIALNASEKALCEVGGTEGYALRCILKKEHYDISPRLHSITANVFKVRQKDSKISTSSMRGRGKVVYRDRVGMNGYYTVFCDEDGSGVYRKYTPFDGKNSQGRFYEAAQEPDGIRIRFNQKLFGFGPAKGMDTVRIIGCDVVSAEHLVLGRLMGYDDQILRVDGFDNILPDCFCVLAEGQDRDGIPTYHFVKPGDKDEHRFCYRVATDASEIHISDPGGMDGFLLHIASCAVTEGARGNIREGTVFEPKFISAEGAQPGLKIENALRSRGGTEKESSERLRLRFLADLREPTVAVTISDYEYITRTTPGLCIHKVKAVAKPDDNLVRIAVKPYGEDERPMLSPLYSDIIMRRLCERKMIGTRIDLSSPVYVPIDVWVVVYAKGYYENVDEIIEKYLRGELNGLSGEMPFGSTISYNQIYKGLEALECIETLYKFSISPRDWKSARPDGPDIIMDDDTLCYPGELSIEIRG
ncbi:MAG: baseplate J/gp47 family protein [Clostridiales Family XIII bacterium]|nr:baseplate J/gp47 family protein [Clostridiales Family XIII bacterium]